MREKMPIVFSAMLIFLFGFRVFTPAHEYMMRPEQVMSMVFDAGILVGLAATRKRMPAWLFWLALGCGISLFLIRFLGDDQWWTGHLTYRIQNLAPRL